MWANYPMPLLTLFLLWMGAGGAAASDPLPSPDALRKELVKATILQRLGLTEKPNLDPTHQISRAVVLDTLKRTEEVEGENQGSLPGQFRRVLNETDDNENVIPIGNHAHRYAKTSQIIAFPDRGPVLNGQRLLSFSLAGESSVGLGLRIKRAFLWIKMDYRTSVGRDFPHLLHPKPIKLYVFQVIGNFSQQHQQPSVLTTEEVSLDLVASLTLESGSQVGWQKLDLSPVLSKWYGRTGRHRIRHQHHAGRGRTKLTLLIDCSGCLNSIYPVTFEPLPPDTDASTPTPPPARNATEGSLPFLALETESGAGSKRNRRRAQECTENVRTCCKQRFFISFQDLGWDDWIIAPRGYYANYCRGHCGGAHRTPDTFLSYHTHVMEEYRRTEAGRLELAGLTPCCAPTKFSSMSLIYFGPDFNVIKRDLPKMIVEECGCP